VTAGLDVRLATLSAEKRVLLAHRLDRLRRPPAGPRPLPRGPGVATFRTSWAQERLWFLEQVAPGSAAYNVMGAFDLAGVLDLVVLQRSLDMLVARHESLRTTFASVDGVPRQVVSPTGSVRLRIRPAEAAALLRRDLDAPFDVTCGPLLRVTVCRLDAAHHVIGVAMHHLISDAWSVTILARELSALYRATLAGAPMPLAVATLQYADYAEWQRSGSHPDDQAATAYWRSQLEGAPSPVIPVGARLGGSGAAQVIALDPALVDGIRACMRRSGTTLFATTLAAWLVVLAERSGLDDVTVLAPVANRERPEMAGIIGFFVNLVALRVRLDDDPTFAGLLDRVRGVVREALRHQALPFERVLTALGVERTLSRPPLSPFAFAVERAGVGVVDLPGVITTVVPLEVTTSRTDLMLVVVEGSGGLALRLEYDARLHEAEDVADLLAAYVECLAGAVAQPDGPVSQLRAARHGDRVARILMAVWEEVLGIPVRSEGDDFFALGGDSLSSIRVVARARRRGLVVTPQQLFEQRTIAGLARVAVERRDAGDEQGPVIGTVEITPIQRILLDADLPDLHHFNMATMLLVDSRPEPALLAIAVEHLLRHHDALRLRLRRDGERWHQGVAGFEGTVPFAAVDLSALDDTAAAVAITARAACEQTTLDLTAGPIVRVVAFDLGADRPSRVLVVVHHLACDAVSWPILLEDLVTLYGQLQRGDAIALPAKSASFQRWAERLSAWGRAAARAADRAFWERECGAPGARLPRLRGGTTAAIADVERWAQGLEPAATATVLGALAAQGVSVEAAGLVGLATAVTELAGDDALLVYLERHGRDVLPEIDVTRTVGWFTAVFPLRLPVAVTPRPEDTLALLVRHLGEIPHGGAGFGLVRADLDAGWHRPEVSFNYLGHLAVPAAAGWRLAPEAPGRELGLRGTRPTILDVTVQVVDGRLAVLWDYDRTLLARPVIERLADRWMTVFCGLAGHTPTRRS